LNVELNKRLQAIKSKLLESGGSFRTISNYLRRLADDLYLINCSLEDDCSTISRSVSDSWLCQIEAQLDHNHKLISIVNKMIIIAEQGRDFDAMAKYVDRISEIDASILDGYVEGVSNRPVDGLMPCLLPTTLENDVMELELNSLVSPANWSEWNLRFSNHITIVNEFVRLFPASHSFASLPCSLSIMLTQINREIHEQSKLENLLEVLTSGQEACDYSSIFGMDVILIKQQLKPVPIIGDEEE